MKDERLKNSLSLITNNQPTKLNHNHNLNQIKMLKVEKFYNQN